MTSAFRSGDRVDHATYVHFKNGVVESGDSHTTLVQWPFGGGPAYHQTDALILIESQPAQQDDGVDEVRLAVFKAVWETADHLGLKGRRSALALRAVLNLTEETK